MIQTLQKIALIGVSLSLVAACGTDANGTANTGGGTTGGGTGSDPGGITDTVDLPSAVITESESIDKAAWELVKAQDTGLSQVVTQAAEKGYTEFLIAGRSLADDKSELYWARYSKDGDRDAVRYVARGCDSEGTCTAVRVRISEAGVISYEDPMGAAVDAVFSAAPTMLKDLPGTDHDAPTQIAAPLTVEEVPEVNLRKRQLTIANAYGPIFGLTGDRFAARGTETGAYTDVNNVDYVKADTIETALVNGSPFDTLIWIGAGVRQAVGPAHRTVGMTINKGFFGDETLKSSDVKEMVKSSPFGGPGLVMLVGEETRGGAGQEDEALSLFAELSKGTSGRIVVGIRGRAAAGYVVHSMYIFYNAFTGGASLADSVVAANTWLEAEGQTARVVSNRESAAADLVFVTSLSAIWDGGEAPTGVTSTHFVNIANICIPSGMPDGTEGQATFFVKVDFDGPFFSGTRTWEGTDEMFNATVEGVLLGKEPGDRVYVKFNGDFKGSIKGLTIWGSGVLTDDFDKEKPGRIFYDGPALATDYTNASGETCTLKSPRLSGATSQPSWIDLP